jgi:hypothetical protein
LREEALHLPGAGHGKLVVFTQFVDAKDRDDVLKLTIPLRTRWTPRATS